MLSCVTGTFNRESEKMELDFEGRREPAVGIELEEYSASLDIFASNF